MFGKKLKFAMLTNVFAVIIPAPEKKEKRVVYFILIIYPDCFFRPTCWIIKQKYFSLNHVQGSFHYLIGRHLYVTNFRETISLGSLTFMLDRKIAKTSRKTFPAYI